MHNEKFDEMVEKFTHLTTKEKEAITIKEIEDILYLLRLLKKDYNVDDNILVNKEMYDINNEDHTQDDYIEAIYVYLNTIKESLGEYVDLIKGTEE